MKTGARALRRLFRRPVILAYHRVAKPPRDPQLLCVSPAHFAEQLEVLTRLGSPVPLLDLVRGVRDGGRRTGVALTFDDGYHDNLASAAPLLAAADTPATVFVTSGYLDGNELWWDRLERIMFESAQLPERVRLEGIPFAWTREQRHDVEHESRGWSVLEPPQTERQRLYVDLHRVLRPLEPVVRDEALDALEALVQPLPDPSARCVTGTELRSLQHEGLIEVGAHTEGHPVLAALQPARQRSEIAKSRQTLESHLGEAVKSFSYPYGGTNDYTDETVRIVEDAGFTLACTTVPGRVVRSPARFELPRFLVRDWNGEEFERRLRAFLAG